MDQTHGPQLQVAPGGPHAQPVEGDVTGGLIPYKNMPALVGYYFAVFSLIPVLGWPLGVTAMVLGVVGLVKRSRQPQVRGAAHAWIAIVVGLLTTVVWGVAWVMIISLVFFA